MYICMSEEQIWRESNGRLGCDKHLNFNRYFLKISLRLWKIEKTFITLLCLYIYIYTHTFFIFSRTSPLSYALITKVLRFFCCCHGMVGMMHALVFYKRKQHVGETHPLKNTVLPNIMKITSVQNLTLA